MPRANIASVQAWRAEFLAEQESQAAVTERWVQGWSLFTLICTVLYILIGHNPYQHGVVLDEATGGAALSPVNRYIWILLTAMSLPLLWARRDRLVEALQRQSLILILFVWFAMTILWAIDPQSAQRRLFLYILNLVIAVGLVLGFNSMRRLHRGLALAACAMVAIDLLSTLILPGVSMTDLGLAAIHSQKNQLGAAMLFCALVIGPYIFVQERAGPRVFWILTFLAAFGLLAASFSKTSLGILLGAMILTPVLLMILRLKPATIRGIAAFFVMTLFLGALGYLAVCTAQGADPWAPFAGINFTQRTDLWVFVFSEIFKRPFTGSGFGSFWDVNPLVQPSLQGELWFGSADVANEAHNGYLDILVTTGLIGLAGALILLFRWIARALTMLRRVLLSDDPQVQADWPAATMLALFPMLILVHNFMESSYFTANQIFGSLILIYGAEIDMRYVSASALRRAALEKTRQKHSHYHHFN